MSIGTNIFELRKENKLTQSELAEKLGVSEQAVSKWENEICSPDVSMFPLIAKIFGVSIDRIFGYHGKSYKEDVDEIIRKINDLGSSYKEIEFLEEALKKYPNSELIKINLAFAYSMINRIGKTDEEKRDAVKKAVSLCEEVISSPSSSEYYDGAYNMLSRIYSETGNFIKAEEAVSKISTKNFDSRIIGLSGIYNRSKNDSMFKVHVQASLYKCFIAMDISVKLYINSLTAQEKFDEALKMCGLHKKILALFDDGGYGFYAAHKLDSSFTEADIYKRLNKTSECSQALEEFSEYINQAINTASDEHNISYRNSFFSDISDMNCMEEYFTKENAEKFSEFVLNKFNEFI